MFARGTHFAVNPERLKQESRAVKDHVIPALRMQAGCSGGLLLGNPDSSQVLTVSLWETEQAMHATDEASYWFRTFGAEAAGGTTVDVETYQVYRACLTHPHP